MSEPFFPTARTGPTAPPGGAYVIPLANVRYIFKGQIFHPLKERDVPLPPHVFFLMTTTPRPNLRVRGEPSQPDGVSWMLFKDPEPLDTPDTEWMLGWFPLLRQNDGTFKASSSVMQQHEVFYDLDKDDWVEPSDVALIETRKLFRVPLWASVWKARVGGLVDGHPKTSFRQTGLLRQAKNELLTYGQPNKPWLIQIDQGLYRSFVRMHYYDVKEKKRKPVPRGPLIEALGEQLLNVGDRGRVAAGTAIDDEGTAYLLHERTKARSANVEYYMKPSIGATHAILDLKAPDATRAKALSHDPSDRPDERYLLPLEWHSFGMQAWLREDPHGFPMRKAFADVRLADTTRAAPLKFHLDDAVLASSPSAPLVLPRDARVTLLDHLLHIRDPDPKRPDLWKTKLSSNYLPAEDAVHVNTEGIERQTLLVARDGLLYDLREKRVARGAADLGKVACTGARAAIENDLGPLHRRADYMNGNPTMPAYDAGKLPGGCGRSMYHLIDASYVTHKHAGPGGDVDAKLMHLLVHLPVTLVAGTRVPAAELEKVAQALTRAAEWWDQIHPAHPGAPAATAQPQDITLVPGRAAAAGAKVVKVRHFFGVAPPAFPNVIKITVRNTGAGENRGGAHAINKEIGLFVGDYAMGFGGSADDGQDAGTTRFVLPHELHHILGHPDEYPEDLGTTGFDGWDQYPVAGARCRPYRNDLPSLMESGSRPRLRHYWIHANRLRQEAEFRAMLDAQPYTAVSPKSPAGALVYELPFVGALTNEETSGPLVPVHVGFFPDASRRCDAALYRLGPDEATIGRMFPGSPLPEAQRFDGLLIVRIKILWDFEADDVVTRAATWSIFEGLFSETRPTGKHYKNMFVITPTTAPAAGAAPRDPPHLRRIAVAFHPEYDWEGWYRAQRPPAAPPTTGHMTIRVRNSPLPKHPLLVSPAPARLELTTGQLDLAILRHALGLSPFKDDTSTTPTTRTLVTTIDGAELQRLADQVSGILKDPAGIKRVAAKV